MKLKLFDLHADTPTYIYKNSFPLDSSRGGVSLDKADIFDSYTQVMAVWSDQKLNDDTCFHAFHKAVDYLNFEAERLCERVQYIKKANDLDKCKSKNKLILSVEDARLLDGRIDRMSVLYARGVRFLTPLWGGHSIIGGAHDTCEGLTDFGKAVIDECFKYGIIPDISHASEHSADEIIAAAQKANKSCIASHSDSYSVFEHSRNLRDRHFNDIKSLGGLVGISLHSPHLAGKDEASTHDVIRHIEHFMSLGGEDTLAFGCDFDGTELLPRGLKSIRDLYGLAEGLAKLNYSEQQIHKLFFENAKEFVKNNIK